MHVRTGTNKDEVSLGKNTTPPPSSWTAHAEKQVKNIAKYTIKQIIGDYQNQNRTFRLGTEPGGAELNAAAVL